MTSKHKILSLPEEEERKIRDDIHEVSGLPQYNEEKQEFQYNLDQAANYFKIRYNASELTFLDAVEVFPIFVKNFRSTANELGEPVLCVGDGCSFHDDEMESCKYLLFGKDFRKKEKNGLGVVLGCFSGRLWDEYEGEVLEYSDITEKLLPLFTHPEPIEFLPKEYVDRQKKKQ